MKTEMPILFNGTMVRAILESATGRAAEELRAVMAGTWAMEGGR